MFTKGFNAGRQTVGDRDPIGVLWMVTARFQIFSVSSRAPERWSARVAKHDEHDTHMVAWRFLSANNRSLGQSVVKYHDVESCMAALRDLQQRLGAATCVTMQDAPGQWTWRIRADGPALAVSSRRYQRRVEALYACMSFRSLAAQTTISEQLQIMRF